jgi:hypothetical protein
MGKLENTGKKKSCRKVHDTKPNKYKVPGHTRKQKRKNKQITVIKNTRPGELQQGFLRRFSVFSAIHFLVMK